MFLSSRPISAVFSLLAALLLAPVARAEDSATSGATGWQSKIHPTYLLWMTGMNTEALNGNRDGTGQNLEFDHYFAVFYDIWKDADIKVTTWAAQIIDEDPSTRQWQPGDPYISIEDLKLIHSDRYAANLWAYFRYYLPVSRGTIDLQNKGTPRDFGNGMVRLFVSPSKSWLDGKLTFNAAVYWNYRFASMTPDERLARSTAQNAIDVAQGAKSPTTPASYREDMYLVLDPSLVYSVSKKVDLYLEWASGYLRHTTSGTITEGGSNHPVAAGWSSINHPTDGMYLSPGAYWSPTKKLFVNPYLSYQLSAVHDTNASSPKRRVSLFHCDVGLQLLYTFN